MAHIKNKASVIARQVHDLEPTTELEALNSMLVALGTAPLASLNDAVEEDHVMAFNTLRDATREVLAMGWKFNTEFGYQLRPNLTFAYVDRDGTTTGLNVFIRPPNLLGFKVTPIREQLLPKLDLILRPARFLAVTVSENAVLGEETVSEVSDITVSGSIHPVVFYDRNLNRDGLDSSKYDYLYIDPVWGFDFEDLPEEARRFILILATRRFLAGAAPSQALVSFTQQDQSLALRNLKAAHGEDEEFNMLDNTDVRSALGHRPSASGSPLIDPRRKSPGSQF